MTNLLNQVTEDDLNAGDIIFPANEVVKFACISARQDDQKGHIYIDCKVLSGEHTDKQYTIRIYSSDNPMSRKAFGDLVYNSGFWSKEELASNAPRTLGRLHGATFQGKASPAKKGKQGGMFQSINNLRVLELAPTQTLPPQQQAQQLPPPVQQAVPQSPPQQNVPPPHSF